MPDRRTLSLVDDDQGISITMRIENDRITRLYFDALDGHSITAGSLRLLDVFGLKLPAIEQPAERAPALPGTQALAEPSRSPARTKASPPAKKAARRTYYRGGIPSDEALVRMWNDAGGKVAVLAESVGASVAAAGRWVTEARKRGVVFEPGGARTGAPE